ncbi:hypothetical protein B0G38_000744 [Arthrobacter sp. VKM Ac-2550]|nr:hypothetical protein [Arthrobacter sp. VKM Ac-2550]
MNLPVLVQHQDRTRGMGYAGVLTEPRCMPRKPPCPRRPTTSMTASLPASSRSSSPGGALADRSLHLWRLELPSDLAVGEHTAEVTVADEHGREFIQTLTFQVTK